MLSVLLVLPYDPEARWETQGGRRDPEPRGSRGAVAERPHTSSIELLQDSNKPEFQFQTLNQTALGTLPSSWLNWNEPIFPLVYEI